MAFEKMFGDRRSVDKKRVRKFDQQPVEPPGAPQQPEGFDMNLGDMRKEIFGKLTPEQMDKVKDFTLSLIQKNRERETVYFKRNEKGEVDIETRPLPDRSTDIGILMGELTLEQKQEVFELALKLSL